MHTYAQNHMTNSVVRSMQSTTYHQNLKQSNQTLQKTNSYKQLKRSSRQKKLGSPIKQSNNINGHDNSFLSIDDGINPKVCKKTSNHESNHQNLNVKANHLYKTNQLLIDLQKYQTQSIGGRSIKTTAYQPKQDYYKYWKNKAHQYLQENFKLREENNILKHEVESLKQQGIENTQIQQLNLPEVSNRQDKSFQYLESIFKAKLQQLQDSSRQKQRKIEGLQDKIIELNRKVLGEEQRTALVQRLGQQVQMLSRENIYLKKKIQKFEVNEQIEAQIQETYQQRRELSRKKYNLPPKASPSKYSSSGRLK